MKFAVVEYSSKTKQIWRHTPERPNYVCDPIREIDPTSFGCYVSALEGEHIPLTGIIAGRDVVPILRIYRKALKRITGTWPMYSLSYFEQFDALLIVYQISDGHEVVSFMQRLKKEYPHIVLLGVPTQPYGILKNHWDADTTNLKEMRAFMNSCDVFLTIVKRTLPQWKKISPKTNVQYMPQPYPVDFASKNYRPRDKKSNIIFVAGVTGRDNIIKGQIVAARLQVLFPRYRIQMAKIPDMELDVHELQHTMYDIVPFEPWQQHLGTLSKTAIVINTDYTQTRGRVQADCAAVGTPSIGANSDAQDDLFPKLSVDRDTSIDRLVLQGKQLLTDSFYYEDVMRTARERLAHYSYIESKKRMEELYETVSR